MSHLISMYRLGDPSQTAVSDLSKVILCLMVPTFEHTTFAVRDKQHNQSTIAAESICAILIVI